MILSLLFCALTSAQEFPPHDSLLQLPADTLQATPPVKRFLANIGNLAGNQDSTHPLLRRQILFTDAVYAGDILRQVPGFLLRELGEPGQPGQFQIKGADSRGIALLLDGRPLTDPVFGTNNLCDVPFEFIDDIELLTPAEAIASGANAPGGVMNIVSPQYDTNVPVSRLRFFQGPFEHIQTDGMFSQNVSRGVNAMVGIQRHVSDGRFSNAAYDSWNARARARFNLSDRLNVWISDIYSKSTIGLNNGIDPARSPSLFDEVIALVSDPNAYQIASRHDLTIGVIGSILPDSASRSKAIMYLSSLEREYSIGGGTGFPPLYKSVQGSSIRGLLLEQRFLLSPFQVDAGAQIEGRHIDRSPFLAEQSEQYAAARLRSAVRISERLRAEASVRAERLRADNGFSWGGKLELSPSGWLTITAEHSGTCRFPTVQELFWSDTNFTRAGPISKETHSLTEIGVRLHLEAVEFHISGFSRIIDDPVTFVLSRTTVGPATVKITTTPSATIAGATAQLRIRFWKLDLSGTATWSTQEEQGESELLVPRLAAGGELSFHDQFIDEALDLKAALRLRSMSSHFGAQFVPRLLAFARQTETETGGFTIIDLYGTAKIGNTYLTLSWENPLNINAMVVPYYPLMNRNIRLGVTWTFFD